MASSIAKTETGIGRQAKIYHENGHFAVQLHATMIYDETRTEIKLSNGGWVTPTTARYMNQALVYREHEVRVFIKNGLMYWQSACGNPQPFDGELAVITL